ncbi:hypothetical protein [Streptomyces lydicus]|uniref:hypothetical protein n=1 Tax=Streptomyces lydicus TaxID=47763 RepID=UPI001010675B|nr:hypothetical protein [Streptomyces lydicus]MCZ1006854.1 hypothetical protein [Streptomyces lydicus]
MTPFARRTDRSLALLRAKDRAATAAAGDQWPGRLAADLRELDATWQESAEVCASAAWAARAAGRSVLELLRPDAVTGHGPDAATSRTCRHLYLNGLRYDFRCRTIESLVTQVPPSALSPDPYSRALYAFSLLGQSRAKGLDLMQQVLADAGDHSSTLHVLLHGLWLGHSLPGRAEHMLAITARPPFAPRTDPIALFREAGALRQLGRYEAALATIDDALDVLPPGDVSVHADLVRERSLIAASHDLHALAGRHLERTPT